MENYFIVIISFFIIATLYSSAGHAGATGYLAIMTFAAFSPGEIKTTALILNIIVATITSARYLYKGYFNASLFIRVAVFSVPAAFIGGYLNPADTVFRIMAGIYLVISSLLILHRVFITSRIHESLVPFKKNPAAVYGTLIGMFSGLIGMGGGVFLSPILLLKRWSNIREAGGITSVFILVNSVVALSGHAISSGGVTGMHAWLILPVVAGGLTGSYLGTSKLNQPALFLILVAILISAGMKMLTL